jgi:2',3'-cyclic-nucleotide 2'-phosphodiesterase (5'-nucleotidase family)
LGGLARKATIIENLINNGDEPIILDAGDLFFKSADIDPGVSLDVAKINAEIINESFNVMGCDGFSPGAKDFAGGLDFLMTQYDNAKFPYISCNIAGLDNELLFKPYVIKSIKGKQVGIIGLASEFENDQINVLNPIESLQNIIDEVQAQSDIVILLFNSKQQDLSKLYTYHLDIDLIISSKGRTRSSDGGSKIPTFIAGDRGKLIYKFNLNLIDKELPLVDIAWCENTIARVTDRLDKMKQGDINANLHSLYKNDKSTLNKISKYESQIDNAYQLLENAINSLEFEKIELGKTVFDRTDILKIVDKGKLKIKNISGPEMPPIENHDGHNHEGHDDSGHGHTH